MTAVTKTVAISALYIMAVFTTAQADETVRMVAVNNGWAKNQVNATIFRRSPLVSSGGVQYCAFYDPDGRLVLAKRALGSETWEIRPTRFTGRVADAHNGIVLGIDGRGVLHMAWNHHGDPLNYCRGTSPGSLDLTDPIPMTGMDEAHVTYPEFYTLPGGDMMFLYRDGSSGNGRTMLNSYDVNSGRWSPVTHPLIDGEGQRNAYTNGLAIDGTGRIHISWCWRETGDVATNHDICYAVSSDGGVSWSDSKGKRYDLPITAGNAETVKRIPQRRELINQTTMTADSDGNPVIATYFRPMNSDIPQYQVIYHDGESWKTSQAGNRTTPFSLSGTGTKRIPISRPKILAGTDGAWYLVFRDIERGDAVSVAVSRDPARNDWEIRDLDSGPFDMWEPSADDNLWGEQNVLHLFVQRVGQGDGETLEEMPSQTVRILEWTLPAKDSK